MLVVSKNHQYDDNTNMIARYNLNLLRMLQGIAKQAADENLFKVIFVASDGVSPAAMKRKSG